MGKKKKQDKKKKQEKLNKPKEEKLLKHDRPAKDVKKTRDTQQTAEIQKDKSQKKSKKQKAPEHDLTKAAQGKTEKNPTLPAAIPAKRVVKASAPDRSRGDGPDMAEIFRAFGDANRLQILELLTERELCAGELLESLDIVQSTLSHHMKMLVDAGIVKCRKQGKWSYYSIDRDMLVRVSEYILKWS